MGSSKRSCDRRHADDFATRSARPMTVAGLAEHAASRRGVLRALLPESTVGDMGGRTTAIADRGGQPLAAVPRRLCHGFVSRSTRACAVAARPIQDRSHDCPVRPELSADDERRSAILGISKQPARVDHRTPACGLARRCAEISAIACAGTAQSLMLPARTWQSQCSAQYRSRSEDGEAGFPERRTQQCET
jgi:hypothetical protein